MNNTQQITLRTPVGINNYDGSSFRCFTRGDTLPFSFAFLDEDGEVVDVTDWHLYVSFSSALNCSDPGCSGSGLVVEVEIPVTDAVNGLFEGQINDEQTLSISCGLTYASIKYTNSNSHTHVIDMCQLEVYPNVNPALY